MIRFIDYVTEKAAHLAAFMFFFIGVIVTYEIVMRKVFNAPTIWVDEVARFIQVWAVYLASAHILKKRQLITVELFGSTLSPGKKRFMEYIALLVICIFSLTAMYYGGQMLMESIAMGRKTSTMLGVPKYLTESAIPVGFGLLFIQAIVEGIKLYGKDVSLPGKEQL